MCAAESGWLRPVLIFPALRIGGRQWISGLGELLASRTFVFAGASEGAWAEEA